MLGDPCVDVTGKPHQALGQVTDGRGEVRPAGELVHALTADAAKTDPDLMRTDQLKISSQHAHDYRRETTCWEASRRQTGLQRG